REVGRPVAGVHVADRDEVAGTSKGEQPPPPQPALGGHGDGGVHLGQALDLASVFSPASRAVEGIGQGFRAQTGAFGSISAMMADLLLYCNSFATASSHSPLAPAG